MKKSRRSGYFCHWLVLYAFFFLQCSLYVKKSPVRNNIIRIILYCALARISPHTVKLLCVFCAAFHRINFRGVHVKSLHLCPQLFFYLFIQTAVPLVQTQATLYGSWIVVFAPRRYAVFMEGGAPQNRNMYHKGAYFHESYRI